MAAAQQGNVEQAVNGAQGPGKVGGEAPEAASAPKAAAAATAAAPHHRRSKSASSGRNLETCKHATMEQRFNQAQNPPDPRKSSCSTDGSSVLRAPPRDQRTSAATASPNHRVSLENDVSQLHLHLHQERSIRIMLDRAIGRASSTLSPGHRHFPAQTKELIAEIELLEEEIANREQHVLSLYRSIFDQCVSGPSSGQSSGISSPAHAKSISSRTRRRQSSIISSAFCSSKKLPLQPFHIMTSVSESGRTKNMLKTKIKHESFSSETLDVRPASLASDPRKLPYSGSSSLARTLKDHLYQCPSKISEEMVRCMASIYCLLRTESPEKPEKVRSPFLSRSSTSVILPRRGNGEETNPSSNKSIVEVYSITVEKNQTPDVSCAITHYRLLVEQLERVDLSMSETSIKLAFWINVYNSLVMHAYLAYGIPNSSLKRMALFHKAAYNVGGYAVTANSIEHSLLCCRSPRIGRWFESILSTAMRKRCADEKQLVQLKFGLPDCQPQALFALCTGASSDPTVPQGVHGEERDGGAGAGEAGVPAGRRGGAQVEEGVPAAPRGAVRQGGRPPRRRRRPRVGARQLGRPGRAGGHPAVRRRSSRSRRPAQGVAGLRVAPVQPQVPLRLRQEHGRQASRRGARLGCSRLRSCWLLLVYVYTYGFGIEMMM
ncbi:uncharacterized protein [Triticum aestivum]|uniref:uncharacterized protein isoform X1 n=1 Tax=Triticum aestivum TaxID=4565 RepID=UPI001D015B6D|nr:uncharacterized protein LOC123052523 isoform X1 [Triticum aestivum]XP_044331679.1 uncharacterized protein LOC123052523 isoform X1 [Triticum aestivum]